MKYDIISKILIDSAKEDFFIKILNLPTDSFESIHPISIEKFKIIRVDYAIKAKIQNSEKIIIIEFQTRWQEKKIRQLALYSLLYEEYYNLPVQLFLILLLPSKKAINSYKTHSFEFKFQLIQLCNIDSKKILKLNKPDLYPFLPLMKYGIQYVKKIEKKILSIKDYKKRVDILGNYYIILSVKDPKLAEELYQRRKTFMIEAPIVKLWRKEALEEGRKEGREEGRKEGREEGRKEGKIEGEYYGKIKIAKKLKEKGFSIQEIIEITELSKKDLKKNKIF